MNSLTRDDLVKKLGLESVDLASQDAVLQEVESLVTTRILREVSEKLDERDFTALESLLDANSTEGVAAYIKSRVPEYDAFVRRIEKEVVHDLAQDTREMQASYQQSRDKK